MKCLINFLLLLFISLSSAQCSTPEQEDFNKINSFLKKKIDMFFDINGTKSNKKVQQANTLDKEVYKAFELLKEGREVDGLSKLREAIMTDPIKVNHIYKSDFRDTPYSNYLDGMIFNSLVEKYKKIDSLARSSAVSYILFSSKEFMIEEHQKVISLFKKYSNNEKENLELLTIFEANILLIQGRQEEAYAHLSKGVPYSKKSIALIKYFAPFKGIVLYSSTSRLTEAMKLDNVTIHEAVIPDDVKYYFGIDGKKIK